MDKFVDRKSELNELNRLLPTEHSQFLIVYGRRRVGKTTLLLHFKLPGENDFVNIAPSPFMW